MDSILKAHFTQAKEVLEKFITDEHHIRSVESGAQLMVDAVKKGRKIISCGNGGSMCDAMHFAEELTGRYRNDRPAIPAVSISDPSHISCVGNDYGYEFIFSRYVEAMGNEGDVLLAITTSGNSKNVLRAVDTALEKGMKVVALTGNDGGKIAGKATVEVRVPHNGYADRIQEVHIKVIHSFIDYIERNM